VQQRPESAALDTMTMTPNSEERTNFSIARGAGRLPRPAIPRLDGYGILGLIIIVAAEVLLILRVTVVRIWFTPIVWTGYILLADNLVYRLKGRSLIRNRRREFLMMLPLSVGFWLIFEVYNFRLQNWFYIGLPKTMWVRDIGFFWAFATILPGIFETTELLEARGVFQNIRWRPLRLSSRQHLALILTGLAFLVIPPLLPMPIAAYTFGFVWLGFILFLDPLNYRWGAESLLAQWERGRWQRALTLLLAGLICGLLWEFWNYWAVGKWVYAVPILSEIKLFEMPVVGFLGFPPFALECYIMYNTARRFLGGHLWAPGGDRAGEQ